jgi:hypothetical protein
VVGWQRPIISNLRGGVKRGPYSIIIHKMTMYIRIYIYVYSNIHKFDILAGASIEYAVTSNLAATDPHDTPSFSKTW